jgi:hypothetical protein
LAESGLTGESPSNKPLDPPAETAAGQRRRYAVPGNSVE